MYESFLPSQRVLGLGGLPGEHEFNKLISMLDTVLKGHSYRLSSLRFKRLVIEVDLSEIDDVRAKLQEVLKEEDNTFFSSFTIRGTLLREQGRDE